MENLNVSKESLEGLKGKAKVVSEIAIGATMEQLSDDSTITLALTIGAMSGLVHGSVKRGVKMGLVTLGVLTGACVVKNLARNWKEIKNH